MADEKIYIKEFKDKLSEVLEQYNIENFEIKSKNDSYSFKIKNKEFIKIKKDFINIAIFLTMNAINIVEKIISKKILKEFILENLIEYKSKLTNNNIIKNLIQKLKKNGKNIKNKEKNKLFHKNDLFEISDIFALKYNDINFGKSFKYFTKKIGIGIEIIISKEKKEIYFHKIDKKHK